MSPSRQRRAPPAASLLFPRPLVEGRFVRRLNRFAALVELAGREARVHVRNSGRLRELLTPSRRVWLEPADRPGRRTRYTLALVRTAGGYVSMDAHLPNRLLAAALHADALPEFAPYRKFRAEPRVGRHRADFLLEDEKGSCLVEVKSVTLVRDGVALFPDAPTARGSAHLDLLAMTCAIGHQAAVVFVIQREDAVRFRPNRATDPTFAAALARAAAAGVRILAYRCRVSPEGVRLDRRIRVELGAGRAEACRA